MYRNGIKNYQETAVNTADPKRLVIMCYQGVIDHLKAAKQRHLTGQYEAEAKEMNKAQDFLSELMHSLDFERGGEIARNLDSLYNYMARRMIYAETNRTVEPVDEVIGLLEELKEVWEEIFFGSKKEIVENTMPYASEPSQDKSYATGYGNRMR